MLNFSLSEQDPVNTSWAACHVRLFLQVLWELCGWISVLHVVFGGLGLEKWNHHLDAARMQGWVNSAELLAWFWKFRSVIDRDLFLLIYSFRFVFAASWSLPSRALARPSAIRPFLAHIAILITSLFVCLFVCVCLHCGRDSGAHQIGRMLGHLPTCLVVNWVPGIGVGQWARRRGVWGTSSFQCRKGCEFSVHLVMLCGIWRPHDQNGKSDYHFSLDF